MSTSTRSCGHISYGMYLHNRICSPICHDSCGPQACLTVETLNFTDCSSFSSYPSRLYHLGNHHWEPVDPRIFAQFGHPSNPKGSTQSPALAPVPIYNPCRSVIELAAKLCICPTPRPTPNGLGMPPRTPSE